MSGRSVHITWCIKQPVNHVEGPNWVAVPKSSSFSGLCYGYSYAKKRHAWALKVTLARCLEVLWHMAYVWHIYKANPNDNTQQILPWHAKWAIFSCFTYSKMRRDFAILRSFFGHIQLSTWESDRLRLQYPSTYDKNTSRFLERQKWAAPARNPILF